MSELLVVVVVLCHSRVLGLSSSIILRTNNRSHPVLKHTKDQSTRCLKIPESVTWPWPTPLAGKTRPHVESSWTDRTIRRGIPWHKYEYSYEYSDGPHGPPRAHPAWLGPPAGPAAVAANPWPGGSLWVQYCTSTTDGRPQPVGKIDGRPQPVGTIDGRPPPVGRIDGRPHLYSTVGTIDGCPEPMGTIDESKSRLP